MRGHYRLGARRRQCAAGAVSSERQRSERRPLDEVMRSAAPPFASRLRGGAIVRKPTEIVQLNIGLYCNQACSHCHVESSPLRTEMMGRDVALRVLELLERTPTVHTVDITGGAPELNREFRFLTAECASRGYRVIDRCNLTALFEPEQEDLVDFLAENNVEVVASLPCYGPDNVDAQRGRGVFDKSIAALQALNARGFGVPGSPLETHLSLVYNPSGAFLAPEQAKLEAAYKDELHSTWGIHFHRLLCLNNMPVKRFG